MENNLIFGILALTCCLCIFFAWFFTHKARHRERLLMIEKGMNPDAYTSNAAGVRKALLKLGVVVIGLSAGLATIGILATCQLLGSSGAIPMSILGLFGGGSLILADRLSKTKN